jgi:16S rRNA (guanine(527)-N(7))-methyltransferase RsmG
MFTRRNEQQLAEIRALHQELGERVPEALLQLKRIRKIQEIEQSSLRFTGPSMREEIDELAARYELAAGAADALDRMVGLVDWEQPNFVPQSDPDRRERDRRLAGGAWRLTASGLLTESLAGLELEPVRAARRVADLGSGAGFPGLVLAIALPQARIALIERVPETCGFLRRAVAALELDNVEVVEGAFEEWSEGREACDLVTSRKVGRLNMMVEWAAPLLAPGGAAALWPGPREFSEEERAAAPAAAESAGLRLEQVHSLRSRNHGRKRREKHLYLYLKVAAG